MNNLNLPPYAVALNQEGNSTNIWDDLRRKWVCLTPEEWVRQHFIHYLIDHLAYPPTLLANEVGLMLGKVRKRVDTIVYNQQLQPIVLIEYKAPNVPLSTDVLEQALRYNYALKVPYLILSNGVEHIAYHIDYEGQRYSTLQHIPTYTDIKHQNKNV